MKKAFLVIVLYLIGFPYVTAQDDTPLLDSTICYEFTGESDSLVLDRWLYHYNEEGQLINYNWLQRYYSGWKIIETQQKTYDSSGNLILQVDNVPRGDWLKYPYVKQEWVYDQQNRPLIKTKYYKQEDQELWTPEYQVEYKHSAEGILIQLLLFSWNLDNEDWYPDQLYTYNYNSFGLETERVIARWNNNTKKWEIYRKDVKTYSAEGVILSDYTYYWELYEGVWERNHGFWTVYDSLGRLSIQMSSTDGSSQLTEYQYDSLGNYKILIANSPPWIGNYIPTIKYEITIDSNGHKIKELRYRKINSAWEYSSEVEYSYISNGILSWESLSLWDQEKNQWTLFRKSHYYYKSPISSVSEMENKPVLIFPNPTSGIISITGLTEPAEVKIYSVQGQLMKSIQQVQNTINIADIQPGVYILNLHVGDQIMVRKIVKE